MSATSSVSFLAFKVLKLERSNQKLEFQVLLNLSIVSQPLGNEHVEETCESQIGLKSEWWIRWRQEQMTPILLFSFPQLEGKNRNTASLWLAFVSWCSFGIQKLQVGYSKTGWDQIFCAYTLRKLNRFKRSDLESVWMARIKNNRWRWLGISCHSKTGTPGDKYSEQTW